MLWSPADLPAEPWANIARHDVIVVGMGRLGLKWADRRFPATSETIEATTIAAARENLGRIKRINPAATVLCEVLFFEENVGGYPPDHRWWLRDSRGAKKSFWPGANLMNLSNGRYVAHVARRIEAVYRASGETAGVFLDNLRFDKVSKRAWLSLLKDTCREREIPICSFDLDWMDSRARSVESIRETLEEFFTTVME